MLMIDVLTLFPEYFLSPLKCGILGRALENGVLRVQTHNFREFSKLSHKSVDDTPYGGGSGMILRPEPLSECLLSFRDKNHEKPFVIFPSPSGVKLNQNLIKDIAIKPWLVFVCGRYEGVDERFLEEHVDLEVCVGDFVLSGGEAPTLAMIEAVSRFIPGVLGNPESLVDESFQNGKLEFPQYTRPQNWNGKSVPEVLLSGHHSNIEKWRSSLSETRTRIRRPDLLK